MLNTKSFLSLAAGSAAIALVCVGVVSGARGGAPASHGKVTPWDAMAAATKKAPGKAYSATYLFEGGKYIYDVIILNGQKITEAEVDATTGKVLDTESVTPEDEGKEMTAELNKAIGKKSAAPAAKEAGEGKEKPGEKD